MLEGLDPTEKAIQTANDAAEHLAKVFEHGYLVGRVMCEKHPGPGPNILFGCRHCDHQDKDKPVGLILMPRKYCICVECLSLWERGKFKFMTELCAHCRYCVEDEAIRLKAIKPTLFVDLWHDPTAKIIKGG